MTARLLAKLEDFRLLPFFVLFSMAIGIAIGNALSISDFALTPPIDSIKSIANGTFEATVAEPDLARRADRPVRDDVPSNDEHPPRRGRAGRAVAAPAARAARLQLPRRAVRHARSRQRLRQRP